MSNPRYGSGRRQFVGQGIEADLSKLDPAAYPGAVAYSEGELYYSNGSEWLIPQDEVDISRPRNQSPLTAEEQAKLRLSDFRSPTGQTQTGIIYEINADGLPSFIEGANVLTRTVVSEVANVYELLYPDDGFIPGDTIWWRAKYLGTGGTQSQFSLPTAQIFPDLIQTPSPVTRVDAIVSQVEVTPFASPSIFGLNYFETQTEFYSADGLSLLTTVTQITGAITDVPSIPSMPEGASYAFRSRYGARVSVGSPVIYSEWSTQRVFFSGGGSMLLEFNLDAALSRTVNLPIAIYDATGLNVTVNWGDGTSNTYTTGGVKSKVYAAGVGPIVNVAITGTMRQFGGAANIAGLKRVDNWGLKLGLTSLRQALRGATATLEYVSPILPTTVTNLTGMFEAATLTNAAISLDGLLTENITNMSTMFSYANFNKAIGGWNTSKVVDMSGMFTASSFNHPSIASWDVSKVTNMGSMFVSASFNQPIGNWNTSSVTTMTYMFAGQDLNIVTGTRRAAFNQDIGAWNVSNVTDMSVMFGGGFVSTGAAPPFNNGGSTSINNWDTSKVTTMYCMFGSNFGLGSIFNQPIGNWNTASVTNMSLMFQLSTGFNQPIGSWNTASVTNMSDMFDGASVFNQYIGGWNTGNVTNMSNMFANALQFNQAIGSWDTSKVTTIAGLFSSNTGSGMTFNQPINNWNVSNVTTMAFTFNGGVFNQPLNSWNVSKVTTMSGMFNSTASFNQDISAWLLRSAGVLLTSFGLNALSNFFYSKMLTGWANTIHLQDGPRAQTMAVTSRTYSNTDFSADFPGKRFANAVDARAFLVGTRSVSVAGASNTTANGTYLYNGANLTYVNSTSTWYFIRVGNRWELRDGSNVVQDTSNSLNTDEPYKETWPGMLAAATILLAGAAWTITGDSLV